MKQKLHDAIQETQATQTNEGELQKWTGESHWGDLKRQFDSLETRMREAEVRCAGNYTQLLTRLQAAEEALGNLGS